MKRIEVYHQGRCHHLDHREPLRLSARLDFADNPTNLYGVAPADSAPLSYGDTVASVRHGGVCNAERISLVPHCHGTHTECIGHILPETHNVADLPLEPFIAATLIRVRPQRADATAESYNASAASEDWLITRAALDDALAPLSGDYLQALVIATEAPSDFRAAACAPLLQPSSPGAHRRTRCPASVGGYSINRPAIRRRTHGQSSPFLGA